MICGEGSTEPGCGLNKALDYFNIVSYDEFKRPSRYRKICKKCESNKRKTQVTGSQQEYINRDKLTVLNTKFLSQGWL
jgi:hypothetical protein